MRLNAIIDPSGDQAGVVSTESLWVRRTTFEPSRS